MQRNGQTQKTIALLTDFGIRDGYVAAMKGVILSINPNAHIIDVTHEISPQDFTDAAFVLHTSCRYFPQETIFVAVVDPGVGSERRIIGVEKDGTVYIAPDNGVLEYIFQDNASPVVHIEKRKYFREHISPTFHGRDIFAPVAAYITLGVPLSDMGSEISDFKRLRCARAQKTKHGIEGSIIHSDRFGNLITSIKKEDLNVDFRTAGVSFRNALLKGIQSHYAAAQEGEPLALINSSGFLEIAVRGGNAKNFFMPGPNDRVVVS